MRSPRPHATAAQSKARVKMVKEALARGFSEDDILKALMQKEQLQPRQARRYLEKARMALEQLAAGVSLQEQGLLMVRILELSEQQYIKARQENQEPKWALNTHKAAVLTIQAFSRTHQVPIKGVNHDSRVPEDSIEGDSLADVLRLFAKEQSLGEP